MAAPVGAMPGAFGAPLIPGGHQDHPSKAPVLTDHPVGRCNVPGLLHPDSESGPAVHTGRHAKREKVKGRVREHGYWRGHGVGKHGKKDQRLRVNAAVSASVRAFLLRKGANGGRERRKGKPGKEPGGNLRERRGRLDGDGWIVGGVEGWRDGRMEGWRDGGRDAVVKREGGSSTEKQRGREGGSWGASKPRRPGEGGRASQGGREGGVNQARGIEGSSNQGIEGGRKWLEGMEGPRDASGWRQGQIGPIS
eukprot:3060000-Rhodomonas_salina.2